MALSLLLISGLVVAAAAVAVAIQWLRWLIIKLRHHQPGPFPIPVLGNLLDLISSPSPHCTLSQFARRYGPLFYLQLGIVPTVIVSTPAAAQQVLLAHDKSLSSRPQLMTVVRLMYGVDNMAFMCPYNDRWRSTRKFYSLHMFNTRQIEEVTFPIARAEILRAILGDVYVASRAGSEVNLSKLFTSLVENAMSRIVLPVNTLTMATKVHEFGRETERLVSVPRIGEFLPILSFLDHRLNGAIDRCHRSIDAVLEEVLREHEERKNQSDRKGTPNGILDVMVASDPPMDRVKMKAMILELTVGGTISTSTALEWTMSELLNNERVMRKAAEEVDRVVGKERMVSSEDVRDNKMPYVRAVVKEALRLHPPVPLLLPHFAAETCDVKLHQLKTNSSADGSTCETVHRIAAGTRILVNVWAIGRDAMTWGPTANEFVPERFLVEDGGEEREVDVRGQDFGLLPFGSGRRMCPGSVIAMFMLELTIATFLHCFEWRSNETPVDMSEDFGMNLIRRSQLVAVPTLFRLTLPIDKLVHS